MVGAQSTRTNGHGERLAGPAIDPELRAAYEACRRMHRRHDPTYYWATRRLPRDVRPATHALYGFVRGADEIVDGPRRDTRPEQRRAALDRWESELRHGLERGRSDHPVIGALVDAGRRHALPLERLDVYMDSMRVDCGPVRIGSWDELERYMQGSAGSVGQIMAPLLGVPPRHHEDFARLGVAFQLTNFIRDVREDWRLDRLYLPREDLERFGVTEDDFERARATPAVRALVAHQVRRARSLFAGAAPAVVATAPTVQPGIRLALAVYEQVLDRVEAVDFDVLRGRARPRPWLVARAAADALRPAGGRAAGGAP